MIKHLVAKLERIAKNHPEKKTREAAKRQAAGFRAAMEAKGFKCLPPIRTAGVAI